MGHRSWTAIEQGALLRAYPALSEFSVALSGQVDGSVELLEAPRGCQLFDDGDACTHLPLLIDGSVRVSKRGPNGDEILLYHVRAGDICALSTAALLGDAPYAATGTVETNVVLGAVPRALFLTWVMKSPPFRTFVFHTLSRRMSELMALVDDVAFRGVAQRLAARLLQHPHPIEATHQALADEVGTRREVVSRILETFQHSGLMRLGRKRIEILDKRALGDLH
jgi:CRP/FNR family transcriptional regulator, anaerobic regulatory protein